MDKVILNTRFDTLDWKSLQSKFCAKCGKEISLFQKVRRKYCDKCRPRKRKN